MRQKLLIVLALVAFCVIVCLPPIIHGYVYPNIGDDTAAHMNILDKVGFFADDSILYRGAIRYGALYIVGYPLDIISHISNVDNDTIFLWLNFLALCGVGVTLFFVFKGLMGLTSGVLALIIPIFTSASILLLFYSGVIFEIINLGIILPLALFFSIKWLLGKKRWHLICALCLFLLFAVFHSTGIYLPFILIMGFIAYILYCLAKGKTIYKWHVIYLVVAVSLFIGLFMMVNPILVRIFQLIVLPSEGISGSLLLGRALFYFMSPVVLGTFVMAVCILIAEYKHILVEEKLTIMCFGMLALLMLPAIFGLSPQPFRQGYDLAIFLSIVTVALLAVVIRIGKYRFLTYILVGLVIGGSIGNVSNWFGYNSALEGVDVEAIHYINALPGDSYSCSDNVDHWIYSRYVDKNYFPTDGEILVTRNAPMKSKVALMGGSCMRSGKTLLKTFTDGDVEIIVYK